jgi:hypothetical protein
MVNALLAVGAPAYSRRMTNIALIRPSEPHTFRTRLRFSALKRESRRGGFTVQDVRDFLMAYCACFLAVSAFIA